MDCPSDHSVVKKKPEETTLEKWLRRFKRHSLTKQFLFGTSAGFLTGLIGLNSSKNALIVMIGSSIFIYWANENGCIKIENPQVNRRLVEMSEKFQRSFPLWIESTKRLFMTNTNVTIGFCGGFVLSLILT
ncbi:uncharacterized protein LOC109595002 isoform X1 [Aethina tumida]|uniref:uncharacterized protein LOC109595002 isoform X1 n=1 Tax=Aethina tumida TaxID=116153 RepID=UPI0021482D17|nr:uncharacterized protein LOC109595002 isoform X1 [Aethina tumida]